MCRRAQGTVRRKAVRPGVLGPKEATLEVDPRRPRHGPSQPKGGPGAPRTSRRSQDHADSDARRSGSPVRRRSMENPPLLHEQDTLGWAVPGRIRIRSRGFRPDVEGADFFYAPFFLPAQGKSGSVENHGPVSPHENPVLDVQPQAACQCLAFTQAALPSQIHWCVAV